MEPRLFYSLSAAQRAQRQLGLKKQPQSMNTNGIDLSFHFLQGDWWIFIANKDRVRACVCVGVCVRACACMCAQQSEVESPPKSLQLCHKLVGAVTELGRENDGVNGKVHM